MGTWTRKRAVRRRGELVGVVGAMLALVAGSGALPGCVKQTENLCADRPDDPACPPPGDDDDDDDDDVVEPDAGPPCGGECGGETPVCDEASGDCVGCLENSDCTAPEAGLCDPDTRTCVACRVDADCPDPAMPRCDPGSLTCGACSGDGSCARFGDTPACGPDGGCVQCVPGTPEEERAACDDDSCDAETFTCTDTPVGSVPRCGACRSDTECQQPEDFCVPMFFMGEPREQAYCLKSGTIDGGGCERPFTIPTDERESLGGRLDRYCGVSETLTTCEAVRDLLMEETCEDAAACGDGDLSDGRCEVVLLAPGRCTYSCGLPSQCPAGVACNNGYCGG